MFVINIVSFCYQLQQAKGIILEHFQKSEYEIKKVKIENFIDDYLETSSSVDETDSETKYDNDE